MIRDLWTPFASFGGLPLADLVEGEGVLFGFFLDELLEVVPHGEAKLGIDGVVPLFELGQFSTLFECPLFSVRVTKFLAQMRWKSQSQACQSEYGICRSANGHDRHITNI